MMDLPKFGGGGSFSAYMSRRRRGAALHYQQKYARDLDFSDDEDSGSEQSLQLDKGDADEKDLKLEDPKAVDENQGVGHTEIGSLKTKSKEHNTNLRKPKYRASRTLFQDCHFYIDGIVTPYEPLLRLEPCENAALHAHEKLVKIIVQHGGMIEIHLSEYVTHYVVERVALGCNKWWNIRQRGGICKQYAVVTPAFVFECYLQNRRLKERDFLPDTLKMRKNHVTLTQLWKPQRGPDRPARNIIERENGEPITVLSDQEEAPHAQEFHETSDEYYCEPYGHIPVEELSSCSDEEKYGDERCDEDLVNEHKGKTDVTDQEVTNAQQIDALAADMAEPAHASNIADWNHTIDNDWGDDSDIAKLAAEIETPKDSDSDPIAPENHLEDDLDLYQLRESQLPVVSAAQHTIIETTKKLEKLPNNENEVLDTFGVEEYYKHSRLHLLGTWKSKVEKEFDFEPFRPLKEGLLSDGQILHIDMDAFFVSVALRDKPHLRNTPVAISHGTGRNSASEIATCNYAARHFGVKKGMWVKQALQRCPNLRFVSYDFDAITETATKILRQLASLTQRIYSASCDEHYLECFLGQEDGSVEHYLKFAEAIVQKIEKETGCPLSVGIGSNMMLAKLASQRCKAIKHGATDLSTGFLKRGSVGAVVDVEAFMASVSLSELPGVGDRTMAILQTCGYLYCKDVGSKEELQRLLGDKIGNTVYQFCQGLDFRELYTAEKRSKVIKNRSITSAINYGVRIKSMEQVYEYMKQLVNQTWERVLIAMEQIQSKHSTMIGKEVTQAKIMLKLRVRAPDASVEPEKYMGCGMCDELTSSVDGYLYSQISVFKSLVECWERIMDKNPFLLEDLRGIAIGIYRIKKAQEEEKHTLDKFLVTVSPKAPTSEYPYYREGTSRPQTPSRQCQLEAAVETMKKETILSFFGASPKSRSTSHKRKRPKIMEPKPYTLFDMRYLQSPNQGGVTSLQDNQGALQRRSTQDNKRLAETQGRCPSPSQVAIPDILKIVKSISNVWMYRTARELIATRLAAIQKAWPLYNGVVAFYREVFASYVTIIPGSRNENALSIDRRQKEPTTPTRIHTGSTSDTRVTTTSRNDNAECTGLNDARSSNIVHDIAMAPEDNIVDSAHANDTDCDQKPEIGTPTHFQGTFSRTTTETTCSTNAPKGTQGNTERKPDVTLFAMRRVCKKCREKFYKSFELDMLQQLQCSPRACVLPRLRHLERSEADTDCSAQADSMVICTLVYATLLRAVMQLASKRRFDLLQAFLDASMHEAMSFEVTFVPEFHRPTQAMFFSQAQTHLMKIYNLAERRPG